MFTTWNELQENLKDLTEAQLGELIEAELQEKAPRTPMILRLYGRMSRLRSEREREELVDRVSARRKQVNLEKSAALKTRRSKNG